VLRKLTGLYVDEDHGQLIQLELRAGSLYTSGGVPVIAIAERVFRVGESSFQFSDDSHLSVRVSDGTVLHYHREALWNPEAREISKLAGTYDGQEAQVTYTVRFDSGRLTATPSGRPDAAVTLRPLIGNTFVFGADGQGLVHFSTGSGLEITTMHVRRMKMSLISAR
jgi:hypothetical protein